MKVISLLVKEVTEIEQNDVNKIGYVLEKLRVTQTKCPAVYGTRMFTAAFKPTPETAEPRSHPHTYI